MMLYITEERWNKNINEGKSIGEMLYATMPDLFNALDKENKNNRVTAAKHQAKDVSTAPRSPRLLNTLPQTKHSVNDSVENNLSKSDAKYSYAGMTAKITNVAKLWEAANMEESGKFTMDEIRKATDWFRGYDGKWCFEIDDSKMQVKDVIFKDSGMTEPFNRGYVQKYCR